MSTTEKPNMPTFSTAAAMDLMWEKSAPTLHLHELEWFANGATEHIDCIVHSLRTTIEEQAMSAALDASTFTDHGDLSCLLFNIGNQLAVIQGLASIAQDAGYRARQALKN